MSMYMHMRMHMHRAVKLLLAAKAVDEMMLSSRERIQCFTPCRRRQPSPLLISTAI